MYVYAAVAPELGLLTSLLLPSADSDMMTLFLSHVSQTFAKYFIVMQVDQAGWHGSKELAIPENIRVISQPAYSRSASIRWNTCGRNCGRNTSPIASFPHLIC
jgi:hypothetical protein